MSKKKIWIITDNYFVKGGLRSLCDSFLRHMNNNNYTIITPVSKPQQCGNSNIICLKNVFNVIYLFRILLMIGIMRKIPKGEKIYFIVGSPLYAIIPILFSRHSNIWFATTFFDEFLSKNRAPKGIKSLVIWGIELFFIPLYYLLENIVFLSDKVKYFALSNSTKKKIVFKKKIKILNSSVEKFWFTKSAEKRNGIISVARYDDPRKDLDTLLKTANILKDIRFTVIGPLPKNFNVTKYDNIRFLGERTKSEIKLFSDKAQLFFMPSRQEGLGIVCVEAMACGIPVISTKNGGIDDIVTKNYNGLFCPMGDYHIAAKKIKSILNNKQLYEKLKQNSYIFAKEYNRKAKKQMEKFYKNG